MQRFLHSRTLWGLSDSFHHHLSVCALAVALLATFLGLAKPADARVVYTQTDVTLSGDGQLDIDLNHDGRADFSIVHHSGIANCTDGSYNVWLDVLLDSKHGSVVGHDNYASALHKGVAIDSGQTFFGVEARMLFVNNCPPRSVAGDWYQVTNRYLGLQGNNHYGWAQVSVSVSCGGNSCRATTKLSGFAFETVLGRTIKTGQTHEDSEANPDSVDPDVVGPGASVTNQTTDGRPILSVEGIPLWRRKDPHLPARHIVLPLRFTGEGPRLSECGNCDG